ncbi:MAG: hypothetical protein R3B49_02325 [Phycisphaerales bacterium]
MERFVETYRERMGPALAADRSGDGRAIEVGRGGACGGGVVRGIERASMELETTLRASGLSS